jgi:hypothetical protein
MRDIWDRPYSGDFIFEYDYKTKTWPGVSPECKTIRNSERQAEKNVTDPNLATSLGKSKDMISGRWPGQWSDRSDNVFTFELTLTRTSENEISGSILWTLKQTARNDLRRKIGLTGTEHVTGTYDPATRRLELRGYRKDDLSEIIGLDIYVLSLSPDGQSLSGSTKTGGSWQGRLSAIRKQ